MDINTWMTRGRACAASGQGSDIVQEIAAASDGGGRWAAAAVSLGIMQQLREQLEKSPGDRSQRDQHRLVDLWGRELQALALLRELAAHSGGGLEAREGVLARAVLGLARDIGELSPRLADVAAPLDLVRDLIQGSDKVREPIPDFR